MVDVGDTAPDFTVPRAGGNAYNDLSPFTLSEAIKDGPVVLAFIPAAFTGGCTEEMCTFRDQYPGFESLKAQVYGVSVDLPFAQNTFIQQHDLPFSMLSDWKHEVTEAYDVVLKGMYDMLDTSQRSVFIIDSDGIIRYKWVRDGDNPEFEPFVESIRTEVQSIV